MTYDRTIKACRPKKTGGNPGTVSTASTATASTASNNKKSPKNNTLMNRAKSAPKNVIIAFWASPEKKTNGQGIIHWYTKYGYLSDFLEANSTGEGIMTYNKTTHLYEIHFIPNESWPKEFFKQALEAHIYLSNPDDDGNYPINGIVVEAEIRSIDGYPVKNLNLN